MTRLYCFLLDFFVIIAYTLHSLCIFIKYLCMVKLTFIRQSDIDEDDIGLTIKTAEYVFLLSKALKERFGVPDCIYSSKEYRSYTTAKIANLGFCANVHTLSYSALRNDAEKREIRAFFDFILSEASSLKQKHLVVICNANVFNYAFIQLPTVGNSITIIGDSWRNILYDYNSSWNPLNAERLSDEDTEFVAKKIKNAICNKEETLLIRKTLQNALDEYSS